MCSVYVNAPNMLLHFNVLYTYFKGNNMEVLWLLLSFEKLFVFGDLHCSSLSELLVAVIMSSFR